MRRLRVECGLTQERFAMRLGLSRKRLVQIEGDHRWPHETQLLLTKLGFKNAD